MKMKLVVIAHQMGMLVEHKKLAGLVDPILDQKVLGA